MARLAAIVPDGPLFSLISDTAREMQEDVMVLQAGAEEVLHAVRKAESTGAEAIIARGFLADAVRSVTSLPVVVCNPGPLDVVTAIAGARRLGKRVALLHFGGSVLDPAVLGASMDIELQEFTPGRTPQEVRRVLAEVKEAGYEVVVGGQVTVDMARSQGLKGVAIGMGKASVRQAIENCHELVKVCRDTGERRVNYSEVLDGLPVGVIATDPRGTIRLCNRAAAAMGAATPADVGRPASEALSGSPALPSLKGEQGTGLRIARLGESRVGIEAVPWKAEGQNAGVVCVLYDVSAAERLVDQLSSPEGAEQEPVVYTFDDIPATGGAMRKAVERAKRYALGDAPVLICGERGTGKEVLAQSIHHAGIRRSGAFGRVSCEGLAADALERRLFGFEKGAFPAARKSSPGVFEICHGGTVFLEEVWALPQELQTRVAAAIEHRTVWRVGGTEPRPVDARVIASSSRDLKQMVASAQFSEALYWRLADMRLNVPPLRERQDDIPALFDVIAGRLLGGAKQVTLSAVSLARLKRYHWPGNVRELEGLIKRLVAAIRSMPLVPADAVERMVLEEIAPQGEAEERPLTEVTVTAGSLDDMIMDIIGQYDRACAGNRSEVARRLGISRTTLWKKMKEK
ncbi:MAG: sigma 54-interacting transcriptional regulator [Ignavibacteriales bacterium]